ncbi:MAG: hypothetical protein EKK57_02810 [Proteobacteria bacterium]|nr:MAG: hypothetical protein EKK57_02810 [Pseudomonadota bacterium]
MKKLILSFLIAAIALSGFGCVTNSDGSKQINSKVVLVAELAAYDGTFLYLAQNPASRPKFEKAVENLDILIENGVTVDAFILIIKSLPIKELQSTQGKLIVDNAIIIFGQFRDDIIKLDTLEQAKLLLPVVTAVRDGLVKGLNQ